MPYNLKSCQGNHCKGPHTLMDLYPHLNIYLLVLWCIKYYSHSLIMSFWKSSSVLLFSKSSVFVCCYHFFSLGNTFLKTHITGSIFTTYIENNWEKLAGLGPEIQSWNLMSTHFILTVKADSLNIFLLWNWLKDK